MDTANNGIEAVQKFERFPNKPDLIIMDYRMSLKNGIDATIEILNFNSQCKIIFTSADSTIRDLALSIGVKWFIEKPFDIDDLIVLIEEALGVKQLLN